MVGLQHLFSKKDAAHLLKKGVTVFQNMCNIPLTCCYTFILEKGVTLGLASLGRSKKGVTGLAPQLLKYV
jgi:hypothetical protein